MKAYLIATNEPLETKQDTLDIHFNPLPSDLTIYLHREDAEAHIAEYNETSRQYYPQEKAWVVEIEIMESQTPTRKTATAAA
jgi:hypothetical protein